MKRFSTLLSRTKPSRSPSSSHETSATFSSTPLANLPADSPEATCTRAIRLFCESAASPSSSTADDAAVAHLPTIVDAAESSPTAAAAAAQQIRIFLGKTYADRGAVGYHAVMLIRILAEHPGKTFTRCFDKEFVGVVRECLRRGGETGRILGETLTALEGRGDMEGVGPLVAMWRKERGRSGVARGGVGRQMSGGSGGQALAWQGGYVQGGDWNGAAQAQAQPRRKQLPSPVELAGRLEEARNTAKILLQLVQSTAAEEVLQNELIREFSDRCQSAQRSMATYINADNPPPDHDTMQTLIETNEQLSLAMSRYQRAMLAARRAQGVGSTPSPLHDPTQQQSNGVSAFARPSSPQHQSAFAPPTTRINGYEGHRSGGYQAYQPPSGPPSHLNSNSNSLPRIEQTSNPFLDPLEHHEKPAPLAFESANYNSSTNQPNRHISTHRPSQSFTIDASDPAYLPSPDHDHYHNRNPSISTLGTSETPTPTSQHGYHPSPILSRAGLSPSSMTESSSGGGYVSPASASTSPQRPGPGAWHMSSITPSFFGRQRGAVDGTVMHGAGAPVEIDGHSEVGRREREREYVGGGSLAEEAVPQQARRVDIAGTGGFRSPAAGSGAGGVWRH